MFGDHEVWKFEKLWNEMVIEFGLEENSWINEMFEKRNMWATTHIRGIFLLEYELHHGVKHFIATWVRLYIQR